LPPASGREQGVAAMQMKGFICGRVTVSNDEFGRDVYGSIVTRKWFQTRLNDIEDRAAGR
jgi:hypothetical protein